MQKHYLVDNIPDGINMNIILNRIAYREDCTFGVLIYQNIPIMVTLEDPWHANDQSISCIPAGVYKTERHNTETHPDTWHIVGVTGRSAILIHTGNTSDDTEGCILVGSEYGELNGKPAVLKSAKAMDKFKALVEGLDTFQLIIV